MPKDVKPLITALYDRIMFLIISKEEDPRTSISALVLATMAILENEIKNPAELSLEIAKMFLDFAKQLPENKLQENESKYLTTFY